MLRFFRISRSAETNESLLIMRLITNVALSLLLIFGIAAMTHSDTDGAGAAQRASTGFVHSTDSATVAGQDQEQILTTPAIMEAALCALGILCGLTALVLILRVLRRPRISSILHAGPLFFPSMTASGARPRATALSLIQLGLSRT